MPNWFRNTLFVVVMISAMTIGIRVYLEISSTHSGAPPETGQLAGTPDTLPEFILNDVEGQPHNIREWAGQPLLINFWATWCAPCRREIPLLQQLHSEKSASGIQVIGIAIDNPPDVEAFISEYGVNYPNLVGEADAMRVSSLFGMDNLGLPFSVLAAADGKVLTVHIGELDLGQLAKMTVISKAYTSGALALPAARAELAAL